MSLNAIKTTTGYLVEGTDAVGKEVELFFSKADTRNYDHLVAVEDGHLKGEEFRKQRAKLPDPERDLYLSIFGSDDEPEDKVLHTTLIEAKDAQNGLSLDWTGDPVTTALRLISKGQSDRLRLVGEQLVDMGPTAQASYQGRHSA